MQTEQLINRARKLVESGYSYAYIESTMYAERDNDTSIQDIFAAIKEAKKKQPIKIKL